jgi:hypothetical protein
MRILHSVFRFWRPWPFSLVGARGFWRRKANSGMLSGWSIFLFCSILGALSTGCHCTKTCVEIPFPGLRADLKQTSTNHGTLRLLIVHGMSNHTQGYSSNFVDLIAKRLALSRSEQEIAVLTNKDGVTNGYLTTTDLVGNETNKLRAYELTWSPATLTEKMKQFGLDAQLNGRRARLNRRIKSTLLNDGFADAILYLNENFRPRIQEPVTNAIWRILDDDFKTNDLLVIVTHSLGSKITFDSLDIVSDELATRKDSETAGLTNLAAGLSYLFMLANQVPLLRLGETNMVTEREPAQRPSAVQKFLNTRRRALEQRQPGRPVSAQPTLRVMAVTDPNDLLSYPLRRTDLISDPSDDIQFGNVFLCNAPAWLGLLANPMKAHEGYFDNPKLVNLVIGGNKKRARVCLKDAPEP